MDDTPPFLVNQEAIDIAIELCLMMHMDIIDEVHIAGSSTWTARSRRAFSARPSSA